MGKSALAELFETEEKIRILRHVAKRNPVTATTVVAATGTSKALVSRYLRLLVRNGFCMQRGREYAWRKNARSLAAKRLLNIDLLEAAVSFPGWARGIGVYEVMQGGRTRPAVTLTSGCLSMSIHRTLKFLQQESGKVQVRQQEPRQACSSSLGRGFLT